MHFLVSREYPVVDYQTMAEFVGHERLFRATDGAFWLHMSSDGKSATEERVIQLTLRDTIAWLNEVPEEFGSLWEFATVAAPPAQSAKMHHMARGFHHG